MKYYFAQQLRILKRSAEEDIGLPFFIVSILIFVLIVIVTAVAIRYPAYAQYYLLYQSIQFMVMLGSKNKIDFLKSTFCSTEKVYRIRLVEHAIFCLPLIFIAAMIHSSWIAIVIIILFVVMSSPNIGITLPQKGPLSTPFKRYPFEFIITIRKMVIPFLIVMALFFIGIYVGNANLSLVCLGVFLLLAIDTMDLVEDEIIIWNYSKKPSAFLGFKLRRICGQLLLLQSPLFILLVIFFPEQIIWSVVVSSIGVLLFILTILMKYAVHPRKIGLFEAMTLAVTTLFLPSILFLYLYYFKKAKRNLARIL